MRQLFLFEANNEEEVEKALAPKEWTMQDLELLGNVHASMPTEAAHPQQ